MVAIIRNLFPCHHGLPLELAAAAVAALPAEMGKAAYRFSVSPAQEVRYALTDARSLSSAYSIRYLTLSHLTPEQASETITAVNLALQSVSRVRQITPCVRISETVLRVDASAYVNDAKELESWLLAWSQIAAADPYHHLTTQVLPYGHTTPQTVTVAGGWTDPAVEGNLRLVTSSPANGAILRADYFAVAALRPPAYYAFAGTPKTRTELLKQLGIDETAIERLQANSGANLHKSGPTKKPRRVVWEQGPAGGVYLTLDSKVGDAFHNPLYRPISADGSTTQHDAEEWFFMLPNGFWGTAIFNAAGQRLDVVDPVIASDYVAADAGAADVQIYAGYSCIRCHSTSGLNSFTDAQTELLRTKRGTAILDSYNGSYVRRVLAFYDDERLNRQMDFDRQTNAMAMARIGCTPAQGTDALASTVKRTEYDSVNPLMAATELCTTVDRLPDIIGTTHDPNAAALAESKEISRDAWKSVYPELAVKRWSRP